MVQLLSAIGKGGGTGVIDRALTIMPCLRPLTMVQLFAAIEKGGGQVLATEH